MTKTPHFAYFREIKTPYLLEDFKTMLNLDSIDDAKKVVAALKRSGIAKTVNRQNFNLDCLTDKAELITDDISEDSEIAYVLNYVGVIYTQNCVLKCYPKYVEVNTGLGDEKNLELDSELRLVLKAIQKYNDKIQLVNLSSHGERNSFNLLGLVFHILQDYCNSGIYNNCQEIIETNGEGQIDWDRTINETFPYLKNERPYYLDLKTIATQNDSLDYFKRLHEYVITECSNFLERLGLSELLDIPVIHLSNAELNDFGDLPYIKYRLEKEISSQFITHKQNLLKMLYAYIVENDSVASEDALGFIGTNALNLVWEKACSEIFGENIKEKVASMIKNPRWFLDGKAYEANTLIPDIITEYQINGENVFCILDSKYYLINTETGKVLGNPGVQDVIKQFVYHEAFIDYLKDYNRCVFNAFLFPQLLEASASNNILIRGSVTMLKWGFDELVPIFLVFLNPSFVWKHYINEFSAKNDLIESMRKIRSIEVFENMVKNIDDLRYLSREDV